MKFSASALSPGEHCAFFCTSPGHSGVMRGKLLLGATRVAQAGGGQAPKQRLPSGMAVSCRTPT